MAPEPSVEPRLWPLSQSGVVPPVDNEMVQDPVDPRQRLIAIIDIGSNSVRLVVYRGAVRNPLILFNEKILCGLGRSLSKSGALAADAMRRAIDTLRRFALLCADMEVDEVHAVATAAVRDAPNRDAFIAAIHYETGLAVDVISGEEEGRLSALGVMSAIRGASGIVGDLGGSSLELVHVRNGEAFERVSLKVGPFSLMGRDEDSQVNHIKKALAGIPWLTKGKGRDFYMVGGAWRALCQLHMHISHHPIPIIHEYSLPPVAVDQLVRMLRTFDREQLRHIPNVAERRFPSLPAAALVLRQVVARLQPAQLVASAYGLREGLLYNRLTPHIRHEDPLIAACRLEAKLEGRFPEHGDLLMAWMNPLFERQESIDDQRLRQAACLLADIAWRGHPDFRAERAVDAAVYGNFIAIDIRGRLMLGVALFVAYSNSLSGRFGDIARQMLSKADLHRATCWGAALRLGQRLTGGTASVLSTSRLHINDDIIVLSLDRAHAGLFGEMVERRLKALGELMKLPVRCDTI